MWRIFGRSKREDGEERLLRLGEEFRKREVSIGNFFLPDIYSITESLRAKLDHYDCKRMKWQRMILKDPLSLDLYCSQDSGKWADRKI